MGKARSYAIRGFWLGAALLAGLSGPVAAAELSAEQMVELERLLYRLNFDPGEIDGVVDERTRTAIRLYQEFAALSPDGEPSPALLAEMRAVAQAFDEIKAAQAAEQAAQEAEQAAQAAARAAEEEQARAAAEQAAQEAAEQAARVAEEEQARAAAEQVAQEAEQAAQAAARAAEEEQARAAAEQAAQEAADQAARVAEEEQARVAAEQVAQEAAEHAARAAEQAAQAAAPSPAPTSVASTTAPAKPAPSAPSPAQAQPEFDLEGVIARLVKRAGPAPSKAAPARPKAKQAIVARAGRISLGLARKAPLPRTGAWLAKKFPPNTLADSLGYVNLKKGYAAAQSSNPRLAIELYTRAIEAGDLKLDHLAGAYYNRANAHHYNGTLNFAIQDYSAAILNKSDFPDAYYNRGFAFEASGQHTRAVADFMKARALGLQLLGVRSPDLPPPRP